MKKDIQELLVSICKRIQEKNVEHFSFTSPKAKDLKVKLEQLEGKLKSLKIFPEGWTTKSSIGQGNLAQVMWLALLPPGQKVSNGIYVALCFGKAGNGFVAGTTVSAHSREKYEYVKTVMRTDRSIDVDGRREEAHYNDAFINPVDVFVDNIDEEALIKHLAESIQKCSEVLSMPPPEKVEQQSEIKEPSVPALQEEAFTPLQPFDADALDKLIAALKTAGLQYDDAFVKRFVCALLAKPFVILTGLSGSGKTKLAQAFTTWLAKKNSLIVPVGADWTNNEHLLGYPDALQPGNYVMPDTGVLDLILRANEKPNEPFFLILDEMNLSHVERYFADFLSAMESKDKDAIKLYNGDERSANGRTIPKSLGIPQNLFVIGTMNVDETTYMFSPKVLDRAQVLEFRVSQAEMVSFLEDLKPINLTEIENQGSGYAKGFLDLSAVVPELEEDNKSAIAEMLTIFFEPLEKIGAEFGYRTASEIMRFCAYYLSFGATPADALDAAAMQKLLPKLHGSQAKLGPVLETLEKLCKESANGYTLTLKKIERMQDRLEVGFTSFAEA